MKNLFLSFSCVVFSGCVQNVDPREPSEPSPAFSAAVIDELRCEGRPDPGPLLQDMLEADLLQRTGGSVVDSVTCRAATGGLSLEGMALSAVWGFGAGPQEWEKYDNLFRRGPGTAPPQVTAVQTTLSVEQATAWYNQVIGTPNSRVRISEPYFYLGGVTEISCEGGS